MIYFRNDDEEEDLGLDTPEEEGEDASLDDDLLDEVTDVEEVTLPDDTEGFGLLEEDDEKEEEDEEEEKDSEDEERLEEDAEDVDYDTFDDVDEL